MANIKVSEMTEATMFDDNDYTMIVQSNQSKKISKENMLGGIETNIGNLSNLTTPIKTDLVNAINSAVDSIVDAEIYSTTEVKTNSVWIDGKPIYRKVIDIGSLPNSSSKSIATGIDFNYAKLVKLYGFAKFSSNNICFPLPLASPSVLSYAIMLNVDNSNNVVVSTGTDRSSYSGYVIIEYTKTTD